MHRPVFEEREADDTHCQKKYLGGASQREEQGERGTVGEMRASMLHTERGAMCHKWITTPLTVIGQVVNFLNVSLASSWASKVSTSHS